MKNQYEKIILLNLVIYCSLEKIKFRKHTFYVRFNCLSIWKAPFVFDSIRLRNQFCSFSSLNYVKISFAMYPYPTICYSHALSKMKYESLSKMVKKILNLAIQCLVLSNGTFTSSLASLNLTSDWEMNSSISKKIW